MNTNPDVMDIDTHHREFERIKKEYDLEEKAEIIANYLLNNSDVTPAKFAKDFDMKEKDALPFLQFIERGIRFKEKHIDPAK